VKNWYHSYVGTLQIRIRARYVTNWYQRWVCDKLVSERMFTTLEPLGICSITELVNESQKAHLVLWKLGSKIEKESLVMAIARKTNG